MSSMVERLKALLPISEALASQDNRCTEQPMFLVRQKKRTYGLDPAYSENVVWLDRENDCREAEGWEFVALEAKWKETGDEPDGWTRTAYKDTDEYVTACFTEKGAESYIARNGHNLSLPSVYADGSYRNNEYRAVRQMLLDLPGLLAADSRKTGPEMRKQIADSLCALFFRSHGVDLLTLGEWGADAIMALLTAEVSHEQGAAAGSGENERE